VTGGVRVVVDARPLQEPERAPLTAAYLEGLLGAFAADPWPGESFVILAWADRGDPLQRWPSLPVAGRRLLPTVRAITGAIPAGDPLLVGGATLGAGWRAERDGAIGTVFHAIGTAAPFGARVPLVSSPPIVGTVLDLAPWLLPDVYQRTVGGRFAARLRRRILRDASAVIVGTEAVSRTIRRLVRVPAARVTVVPFAPREPFAATLDAELGLAEAARHGLGGHFIAYAARFEARHDLPTLLAALAELAAAGRPSTLADEQSWPPRVALIGASPDDRAAIARAAARVGVGESLAYVGTSDVPRQAALLARARAVVVPARTDAVGLAAIEALAVGVPVVASGVDALPEIVAEAGLVVPPRQPGRLATAIASLVTDDRLHASLASRTTRASAGIRSWRDVARETREVYARSVTPRP
jgi:glycosyltransferase involved in cell wall biosynthesis